MQASAAANGGHAHPQPHTSARNVWACYVIRRRLYALCLGPAAAQSRLPLPRTFCQSHRPRLSSSRLFLSIFIRLSLFPTLLLPQGGKSAATTTPSPAYQTTPLTAPAAQAPLRPPAPLVGCLPSSPLQERVPDSSTAKADHNLIIWPIAGRRYPSNGKEQEESLCLFTHTSVPGLYSSTRALSSNLPRPADTAISRVVERPWHHITTSTATRCPLRHRQTRPPASTLDTFLRGTRRLHLPSRPLSHPPPPPPPPAHRRPPTPPRLPTRTSSPPIQGRPPSTPSLMTMYTP